VNGPISWFARNRVAANLLLGVIVLGGLVSLPRMPQKSFPDLDINVITVAVEYLSAFASRRNSKASRASSASAPRPRKAHAR